MTTPKKPSAAVQAQIDAAVQTAVATATQAATNGLVAAASKPELVTNLRKTWRKSGEHLAEQIGRFLRLTVLAAIPAAGSLLFSKHFDSQTLLAFILPFAEVAFRQVFPALGAEKVDQAPGATIVPDQVADPGATPAPVDTPPLPPAASITGLGGVPVAPDAVGAAVPVADPAAAPVEGDAAP